MISEQHKKNLVDQLNKEFNKNIASLKSNIALFTGGGIISEEVINKFDNE